jgi:hypothetical protein
MFEEQAAQVSDRDHVRCWIGVLSVGEWPDYGAPISALMNLSDYADAITEADAQRLDAVLRQSPLLDDPELMRQIRGIRREYPDEHWWWYPERLLERDPAGGYVQRDLSPIAAIPKREPTEKMFEIETVEVSDLDHVRNMIGLLSVGTWPDYSPPITALMNLSDYADAITEADAQRLGAVLRGSPLLDDPELMRRIRGIRRDYPNDHWWWYPERLQERDPGAG